jgi:hypothetical protein
MKIKKSVYKGNERSIVKGLGKGFIQKYVLLQFLELGKLCFHFVSERPSSESKKGNISLKALILSKKFKASQLISPSWGAGHLGCAV